MNKNGSVNNSHYGAFGSVTFQNFQVQLRAKEN